MLPDTATTNPYRPGSSLPGDATQSRLTRFGVSLLMLLAVVLLFRGGLMLFSWAMQQSSGFKLDSHFHAAILTKDAVYGLTAFIGGLMLLARHKLGWWFALVHWCWYVACEIFVVAAGATLGWQIPVHYDPPMLYRVMGFSALLATTGLSILLWRPIANACNAPASRRYVAFAATMISSVVLAFAVNWWMSQR